MPDLICHIDDIGATAGSVTATERLVGNGLVASGSIIVNSGWFPAVAELAGRRPDIDFGIHLTLTSESEAYRWRPLSTVSQASGLIDDDGFFWPDVPSVRRHAHPEAVAEELTAQIERAVAAGVRPSHVDHHMGAALVPELAPTTLAVATAFSLPVLFPTDMKGYAATVELGDEASDLPPVDLGALAALRPAPTAAFGDHFLIGLRHLEEPAEVVYRRLLADVVPGTTFVSLHCNAPGEVELVHPADAHFRIDEYRLFGRPDFTAWVTGRGWLPRSVAGVTGD